jgi:FtsH-binding integral membrane protein
MDKKKLQQRLPDIAAIFIGLQILAKAIDKAPYFFKHPFHVGFLFTAALFIIVGSIFHHHLEKRIKHVHAAFHFTEGLVLIIYALLLLEKGKFRLPAIIIFCGFLYMIMGLLGYILNQENIRQLGKPVLRSTGIVCLLFAVIAIALNFSHDKNIWVFVISVLFFALGIFYTAGADWIITKMSMQKKENH